MSTQTNTLKQTTMMVLTAVFSALIIAMTFVPYTGYISYGGVIEITTLHIVTILAAVSTSPLYGAVVGGVWGATCLVRAYMMPQYLAFGFGNFFVAMLPRILVGFVAGLVFWALKKTNLNTLVSAGISAVAGTLTNTVLVLSAMNLWGKFNGKEYSTFYEVFSNIIKTLVGVNGLIELIAAVVIVSAVYKAIEKTLNRMR